MRIQAQALETFYAASPKAIEDLNEVFLDTHFESTGALAIIFPNNRGLILTDTGKGYDVNGLDNADVGFPSHADYSNINEILFPVLESISALPPVEASLPTIVYTENQKIEPTLICSPPASLGASRGLRVLLPNHKGAIIEFSIAGLTVTPVNIHMIDSMHLERTSGLGEDGRLTVPYGQEVSVVALLESIAALPSPRGFHTVASAKKVLQAAPNT